LIAEWKAMNKTQIAIIGVALCAGVAAYMLTNGEPSIAPATILPPTNQIALEQVLVAARDLPYGAEIGEADVSWVDWPKASLPNGALTKGDVPEALADVKAAFVRIPFQAGEPIRKDRIVKGVAAGLMSTMLSPGMRAVAIDVSLNTTAGGFILPNDRVDILRTFRDPDSSRELGRDVYSSEVLLSNIRVLAVGQAIEKKGGEAVAAGSTATLELTPVQAEFIVLSQRGGQLTLVLRPIFDGQKKPEDDEAAGETREDALTLVRRGVPATVRAK
jgi:pilus assembly protein CpaB